MTYLGIYTVLDSQVTAEIRVDKYAAAAGTSSVVGFDHFTLKVSGLAGHESMVLSGFVAEDPTRKISIKAKRRAEI
jgi:hypothetical protein